MFGDIGWAELMVIGIVALIVIGPEDLPQMFRQLGRFTAKLRSMGREFSRAMEQAAKDTGVNDVARDLKAATSAKAMGLDKVKEAADRFEKWDPMKNKLQPTGVAQPLVPAPMPATPPTVTPAAPVAAAPAAAVNGPATQALLDKQAAKKAIMAETAEKLKALDTAEAPPAPKPRAKKTAPVVAPVVADTAQTPKAKAPRKSKKADEA